MIWYLENPQRFRQEREALERLASSSDWLVPGEWRLDGSLRIAWDADIVVGGHIRPVTVQYPNHFPHSPPLVLPRDSTVRWSSHQYGAGGELCLEIGPDNWHQELGGVDMIQSAHRLLQGETPAPGQQAIVASRHATTLGQDMRNKGLRLLVTSELRDVVATLPERAIVAGKLVGMYHEESIVYAIGSLVLPGGAEWVDQTIPKPLKYESHEPRIMLIRWPADVDLPSTKSAKELRAATAATDPATREVGYLFIARGTGMYGHRLWDDDDTISEISAIPAQTALPRMDQSHASLVTRKVAIVGCGSLGSKLAVMLARSGVGKFLLVDDDVMLPDNLVRHDLDWRDIGVHKANAVARRIQLVNPSAECQVRRDRLGGQESSGSIETLISSLANCDLIVDATADAHAFGYLSAAASTGSKPFLWAEVFGAGIGGLIARHRPSLEPDPASMRRAIENWCREQGKPIEHATIDYETRGSGPPLIADDADVAVIAAHASRLAIDTLIPRNPSMFPNSVYMIGLAHGWIFDQPFDTRPIDVGTPDVNSTPAPVDQQIVDEEMARIRELFRKYANATPTDTSDHSTPAT